jgi:hypothetical protein
LYRYLSYKRNIGCKLSLFLKGTISSHKLRFYVTLRFTRTKRHAKKMSGLIGTASIYKSEQLGERNNEYYG